MSAGLNGEQWREWLDRKAGPSAHVHVVMRYEEGRQEHVVRPEGEDPASVLGREVYRRAPMRVWADVRIIGGAAMWTTLAGVEWTVLGCEREGCLLPQNYPQVSASAWPVDTVVPGTTQEGI